MGHAWPGLRSHPPTIDRSSLDSSCSHPPPLPHSKKPAIDSFTYGISSVQLDPFLPAGCDGARCNPSCQWANWPTGSPESGRHWVTGQPGSLAARQPRNSPLPRSLHRRPLQMRSSTRRIFWKAYGPGWQTGSPSLRAPMRHLCGWGYQSHRASMLDPIRTLERLDQPGQRTEDCRRRGETGFPRVLDRRVGFPAAGLCRALFDEVDTRSAPPAAGPNLSN